MEKTDIAISSANRHISNENNDNNNLTSTTTTTTTTTSIQNVPSSNNYITITMDDLLKDSQFTLLHVINTQIVKLLKTAKGIAFVKLLSLGVGDIIGNGVVIKHDTAQNKWYGPCAVSATGVSMRGNGVGVEEINAVLLINDENFFPFLLQNSQSASSTTTTNATVATDMTIIVGTVHDNYMVSSLPKIVSYSFSKGVEVDFAFEKISIVINNKINKDFYQKTVNAEDIFNGNVKPIDNKNCFELCNNLASCANGSNDNKHIIHQRRRFELNKNTPLYQYYMGNNKNIEYNYHQLSQLPSLPFVHDIKNKKISLINTKGWLLGKKIFRGFKKLFQFQSDSNKNEDNKNKSKYVFDANMPVYQYYTNGELIKYDSKQLYALPKFPFLNEVRSYHNFDFWKSYFVKDTKKVHNEKHTKYVFDELIPLYQYYSHNGNLKEVKYNYKILSNLPTFPFSDDIKSKKIQLKQYNPINIIKNKIKSHQVYKRKASEKSIEKQWHFDENAPLYQYYMNSSEVKSYDKKQLSTLPTFPFLKDVTTKKYKLQAFDPVGFVKSFYSKYVTTSSKKL